MVHNLFVVLNLICFLFWVITRLSRRVNQKHYKPSKTTTYTRTLSLVETHSICWSLHCWRFAGFLQDLFYWEKLVIWMRVEAILCLSNLSAHWQLLPIWTPSRQPQSSSGVRCANCHAHCCAILGFNFCRKTRLCSNFVDVDRVAATFMFTLVHLRCLAVLG